MFVLLTGGYTMISDSDGRNYPWYGSRTEVSTDSFQCSYPVTTLQGRVEHSAPSDIFRVDCWDLSWFRIVLCNIFNIFT